ncbi:NF-kappa-B-repressing factor [Elysia marginata]|uniref:NF-kappa-B-repressing factor n=1 Tax=Elysia marginata TaxID=1093978 RepID=A0AAV4HYG6_9GAST|nr:NF-kappa-B-repressing factor [Elysia marginata]
MAGLGFRGTRGGRGGSNSQPMGIQFVKSSDSEKKPFSSPIFGDQDQSRRGTNPAPSQFGLPAKQFDTYRGKGSPQKSFNKSFNSFNTFKDSSSQARPPQPSFPRIQPAKLVVTPEEYRKLWQQAKDPDLVIIRKLAWEVATLKSDRPNAIDKLHSASNRVPTRIEFTTEPMIGGRGNNSFKCLVFIERILVGSGQGLKIKDAKVNGYEAALQTVLMPELRVVKIDRESKKLEGSKEPFTTPPPEPSNTVSPRSSSQLPPSFIGDSRNGPAPTHRESNLEAASVKRRIEEQRPLEDFVIVEPLVPIPDCTPAHTLRRSADFNHMLLEYEYVFCGETVRCVLWLEGQVLADVSGSSKLGAKNKAAGQGLRKLKQICWVIKTKKAVDSDSKISKEEILNELTDQSDALTDDNVGNKMLRKMGWSGGGVGKDGSGIAEPVSLKSVYNREGLGLGTERGITDEYRRRVKEVIENYAASGNQEDLVFNCDFRLEERLIIHDECRRLNLRSKCKGKGAGRYLCIRRKRSANMLFDHIMSCGGETIRYKLVPPERDTRQRSENIISDTADSETNQPHCGPDVKGKFSFSTNHIDDLPPPGSVKGESNQHVRQDIKWEFRPPPSLCTNTSENTVIPEHRFVKQEVQMEFGPPPPFPTNTPENTDSKDRIWEQNRSNQGDSAPSSFIKKEFDSDDFDDQTKIKEEIEPPHCVNGHIKEEISAQANYGIKNEVGNGNTGNPNSCYPGYTSSQRRDHHYTYPVKQDNNHRHDGASFDLNNGRNFNGNPHPFSNPSGRFQPNSMGSLLGQFNSNSNSASAAANFLDAGPKNPMMRPGNMHNQFMGPGNNFGYFNQPPMPSHNHGHYGMQGFSSNMNSNFGTGNQWPRGPHQNQQFLQIVSQKWGEMAAQWLTGQQGSSMGNMQNGPRFNGHGQGSGGHGMGRGRMM